MSTAEPPVASVPGPPHGRRRRIVGDVSQRVEALRAGEREAGGYGFPLLGFARDVILLLKDLARDPRVSRQDKVVAVLAAAYLVSPVDLVPDKIPVLGQLDDLSVAALALRRLMVGAGYEVIYELWRGSDEGLSLVLALGGVQE